MTKTLFVSLSLSLCIAGCTKSSPPSETDKATAVKAVQPKVVWTGGQLGNAPQYSVSAVLKDPASFEGKRIGVTGEVSRVCQHKGCWIELKDGDKSIIIKSLDHRIAFPKDGASHHAQVEGIVRLEAESCGGDGGEGHTHEASHEGDKETHDCPQPKMLVEVLGAKLIDRG